MFTGNLISMSICQSSMYKENKARKIMCLFSKIFKICPKQMSKLLYCCCLCTFYSALMMAQLLHKLF